MTGIITRTIYHRRLRKKVKVCSNKERWIIAELLSYVIQIITDVHCSKQSGVNTSSH